MGIPLGEALNTDNDQVKTSAYSGDPGDGTNKFYHFFRKADGGDVAQGSTTDTADTATDATPGTVIGLLKGVIATLAGGISATFGAEKAEDAAHSSGDTGAAMLAVRRDTAVVGSGTDGDYSTVNVDANGRLYVKALRDDDDALSVASTSELAADLVVKASAGTLHSIVGTISSGEVGYVQVHDAASAPADTAVPELSFYIDASSAPVQFNIPLPGHVCATGITISWSTTLATLTSGAAKMMIAAYYE